MRLRHGEDAFTHSFSGGQRSRYPCVKTHTERKAAMRTSTSRGPSHTPEPAVETFNPGFHPNTAPPLFQLDCFVCGFSYRFSVSGWLVFASYTSGHPPWSLASLISVCGIRWQLAWTRFLDFQLDIWRETHTHRDRERERERAAPTILAWRSTCAGRATRNCKCKLDGGTDGVFFFVLFCFFKKRKKEPWVKVWEGAAREIRVHLI